jgi:predicted transposase YdaD
MSGTEEIGVAHPHDSLVRNVLADTELVADLLRNYLEPELVSTLDLNSLKRDAGGTVSPNLSKLEGDLRYSARFKGNGGELRVLLLLEHQSRPDRLMSFRMLDYVCSIYRERVPGLKKGKRFPYPLAVVLHHGESPWKEITPMRKLIDMTPEVEQDILRVPIRLIDVATMSVDELRGHPMVCALLDSLQSASTGALPRRMRVIFSRLHGLGGERRVKQWVTALLRYYSSVRGEVRDSIDDFAHILMGVYGKREAETMATTMYEAIHREGRAEGKAEGEIEGQAKSVILILESRFGEVPAGLQKKLLTMRNSARIEEAIKLAATCRSLKEFQKAL